MKSDLLTLYKGILYGFCPCHGYIRKLAKPAGFTIWSAGMGLAM